MTLPTGSISFSQINTEILRPATQTLSLNDATVRVVANIATGPISMNNLRGKSYFTITGGSSSVSGGGSRLGVGNVTATTEAATISVLGGQSPYTYVWELISGTAASHSNAGTTTFTRTTSVVVGQTVTLTGVYRCKVTDANGAIAYGPMCTVTTSHNETS